MKPEINKYWWKEKLSKCSMERFHRFLGPSQNILLKFSSISKKGGCHIKRIISNKSDFFEQVKEYQIPLSSKLLNNKKILSSDTWAGTDYKKFSSAHN